MKKVCHDPIFQVREMRLPKVSQLVTKLLGLEAAGLGSALGSLLWLGDLGE